MTGQREWGENKNISQVIEELKTFEDLDLMVMVSDDGGYTLKPVRLLGKEFDKNDKAYCTLFI